MSSLRALSDDFHLVMINVHRVAVACSYAAPSLLLGVGYYLSSSVNPLLYSVMSKRFRRGFRDMFSNRGGSAPSHAGTSGGDHGGEMGDRGGSVLHRQSTRRGRGGGSGGGGGGSGGRLIGQYPLHEWQRTAEDDDNGIAFVDAASYSIERDRVKKP